MFNYCGSVLHLSPMLCLKFVCYATLLFVRKLEQADILTLNTHSQYLSYQFFKTKVLHKGWLCSHSPYFLNLCLGNYIRTADEVVNIKKEPIAIDLKIHSKSNNNDYNVVVCLGLLSALLIL